MKRSLWVATIFLSAMLSVTAFGQSGNGRISGTIDDSTGAVLPGVTVTATNTATGVAASTVSNEAGAYNFASLLPGPYKVTAELPGFQQKVYEAQVGNTQELRLNIRMTVGSLTTNVEVSVPVDSLLATSSASVGSVLSDQRMQSLPIIGNNVLGLLDTLPGTRLDANGVTGTFAGLGARSVAVTRDGMESSGAARNMQAGLTPSTYMSPDLIGEMRLVIAPVDAEMGTRQRTDAGVHAVGNQPDQRQRCVVRPQQRAGREHVGQQSSRRSEDRRMEAAHEGLGQPESVHGQRGRTDR